MKSLLGPLSVALILAGGTNTCVLLQAASPSKSAATAQAEPVSADFLTSAQAFSPFVGEWTIDATWEGGEPLKARNTAEWALDGKHLKWATYVNAPTGEYKRYEGFMTWNAQKKSLVEYSFAVTGEVSELRVSTDDLKTYRFGFSALPGNAEGKLRQTIQFLDADSYRWTAEFSGADGWKPIIDGVWRRKHVTISGAASGASSGTAPTGVPATAPTSVR